jgi:hypothetical protein
MVENVPLVGIHKTHIFSSKESDGHTWTIKKGKKDQNYWLRGHSINFFYEDNGGCLNPMIIF